MAIDFFLILRLIIFATVFNQMLMVIKKKKPEFNGTSELWVTSVSSNKSHQCLPKSKPQSHFTDIWGRYLGKAKYLCPSIANGEH